MCCPSPSCCCWRSYPQRASCLDFPQSHEIINPYGNAAKMYGKGIDARDSHFAATLFIGTDFMILFLFAPLFARTFFQNVRKPGPVPRLKLVSVYAAALYYAASVSLGVA